MKFKCIKTWARGIVDSIITKWEYDRLTTEAKSFYEEITQHQLHKTPKIQPPLEPRPVPGELKTPPSVVEVVNNKETESNIIDETIKEKVEEIVSKNERLIYKSKKHKK